jgi:signal peptidase I
MENQDGFQEEPVQSSKMKNILEFIVETIKVVVISFAIIFPVRYYLIQPFIVRGDSMYPTFENREYLIVDEISYRFNQPKRGDVVVFRYKHDPKQFFIKRVIGLPGEKVEIAGGKIKIYNEKNPNGIMVDESVYLSSSVLTLPDTTVVVEDGEYFVLGDNRDRSKDSRSFGAIKKESIVGKTWFRGWPFERVGWFETTTYNF